MGVIKQINIKNRTYYFYNDIIDLKIFDARLLKIDKKSYKKIGIYNIRQIIIKKIDDFLNGIRDKIKEVCGDEYDYEKDYMKIKFNSDDDLPLKKKLKFHNMTITIRSVFEEDGKLYPQVFLDDTLYELNI